MLNKYQVSNCYYVSLAKMKMIMIIIMIMIYKQCP